jgi:hypothetical protein
VELGNEQTDLCKNTIDKYIQCLEENKFNIAEDKKVREDYTSPQSVRERNINIYNSEEYKQRQEATETIIGFINFNRILIFTIIGFIVLWVYKFLKQDII